MASTPAYSRVSDASPPQAYSPHTPDSPGPMPMERGRTSVQSLLSQSETQRSRSTDSLHSLGGTVQIPPPPPARIEYLVDIFQDIPAADSFILQLNEIDEEDKDACVVWRNEDMRLGLITRVIMSNIRLAYLDTSLGKLSCLMHLNLTFNKLIDVSVLEHCKELTILDISHNKIVSIDAVRHCKKLGILRCHDNQIESMEPIMYLSEIRECWVSNNDIPWTDFIYLSPLIHLRGLIKENNKDDSKRFLNKFVLGICPHINYMDGTKIRLNSKDVMHPSDFLLTTDGKGMIAQAKATLNATSRGYLSRCAIHVLEEHERRPHNHGTSYYDKKFKNETWNSVAEKANVHGKYVRKGRLYKKKSDRDEDIGDEEEHIHASYTDVHQDHNNDNHKHKKKHHKRDLRPIREDGMDEMKRQREPQIRKYQAQKSKSVGVPSRVGLAGKHLQEFDGVTKATSMKVTPSSGSKNRLTKEEEVSMWNSSGHQHSPEGTNKKPVVLLRYDSTTTPRVAGGGDQALGNNSDPVALCVYRSGDGFARWSKGGPVAASRENRRMFSSYENGSLACVLDPDGNGSIMTHNGKCVCLITASTDGEQTDVAKILDEKTGEVLEVYEKADIFRGSDRNSDMDVFDEHGSAEFNSPDRVPSEAEHHEMLENRRITVKELAMRAPSKPNEKPFTYSWKHGGLALAFVPSKWEVKVRFENDRFKCDFSSIHGGRVLKEKNGDENAMGTEEENPFGEPELEVPLTEVATNRSLFLNDADDTTYGEDPDEMMVSNVPHYLSPTRASKLQEASPRMKEKVHNMIEEEEMNRRRKKVEVEGGRADYEGPLMHMGDTPQNILTPTFKAPEETYGTSEEVKDQGNAASIISSMGDSLIEANEVAAQALRNAQALLNASYSHGSPPLMGGRNVNIHSKENGNGGALYNEQGHYIGIKKKSGNDAGAHHPKAKLLAMHHRNEENDENAYTMAFGTKIPKSKAPHYSHHQDLPRNPRKKKFLRSKIKEIGSGEHDSIRGDVSDIMSKLNDLIVDLKTPHDHHKKEKIVMPHHQVGTTASKLNEVSESEKEKVHSMIEQEEMNRRHT